MGKADLAARRYLADPARFADAFNYAAFGGERVVRPEGLRQIDSAVVTALPGGEDVERRRDVARLWQAMVDDRAAYALLGIESQADVHYAMPVRCMLYDALSYAGQVDALGRARRREGGGRRTGAEFLSGMGADDRLLPVVTLVVHFGAGPWDGELSLHGMLGDRDERLLALVPDYRVNIISPALMDGQDFRRFETELGLVLEYIKYSGDKERLRRLVAGDPRFQGVGAETARLINVLAGSHLSICTGEETVDMCNAIEDMRNEALLQGIEQGIEQGVARGARDKLLENVRSMVRNLKITAQQALDVLDVPESERPGIIAML